MAAESNTGFHYDGMLISALNRHTTSFHSNAINSTPEMIPLGNYFGMNNNTQNMIFSGNSSLNNNMSSINLSGNPNMNNNTTGMIYPGNSNALCNSGMSQGESSSGGSRLLDYASEPKQDPVVEWSFEEQFKLEDGLAKFSAEPSIMKYIKIAATLREKNVRDVAMRCRWMTRKRRKQDEIKAGRKSTYRKDKLAESSSKNHLTSDTPAIMASQSLTMHNMNQNKCMPFEAVSSTTKHRLEQNIQVFNQITANLSAFKLQENIDLFSCTRNNITAILNDMNEMPGIMSRMPPLPVTLNENLADSFFADMSKSLMYGSSPRGFQLKEEPRY